METITTLKDMAAVTSYMKNFGMWAPLIAFMLFTVQAALPVFPYIILASAGGILFGFKTGFLLAWSGALVGACIAYWISRYLGADWVIEQVKVRFGYDLREMDQSMAFWSIVLARVIPVIPTPVINVAAAVGGVPFWTFFFSSAIGKIPTAILYTGLGICLFNTRDIKLALIILGAIAGLAVAGKLIKNNKKIFLKSK
ncbi:TVP38/TMEM64 family protein [Thermosyntropha sp.]|uniref:TVP38/TMEM64 family protein n=1 Tax=Thermosyntropha sp. TaxID=2740820 RepID=UPI0025FFB55C|nr:TVP38/TMEM64 family protein [Thermosyntropha sp.]MBO8159654.1 TVP38/TMEM64 family protein [Thermosyntropha sp.]